MDKDTLFSQLAQIVGADNVLTGTEVSSRAAHFYDASPLIAAAIVRPADTAQTAAALKLCHEAGQVVVTHGGTTGLVNGHVSTSNDIVLSLERMNAIDDVDVTGRTVTVGAGAILQNVQHSAEAAGLQLCIDLGARGSCTIGGNIATNAGGLSVLRYGMTREQVLGLEVVLADGTTLSSMNRMMKNNAGYDLKQLFIGSEGTLGIITRAVLRLRPATPAVATGLLAFDTFDQLTATLSYLSHTLNGTLDAFEVIWQPFYALNTDPELAGTSQSPLPRDYNLYAIVESRGSDPEEVASNFEQALGSALEDTLITDAVIAQSGRERQNIWHIREHIDIALQHEPVFVYDISLPITDMQQYVDNILKEMKMRWPDVIIYVYGHLADGNLHVLVAPPGGQDLSIEDTEKWHEYSNQLMYQPLQSLGGSVSAEHGIGLSKKPYLSMSRSAAEILLMQSLKHTLDPSGILNPGKIID